MDAPSMVNVLPHTYMIIQMIYLETGSVISEQRFDNPSDEIITILANIQFSNMMAIFKIHQYNLWIFVVNILKIDTDYVFGFVAKFEKIKRVYTLRFLFKKFWILAVILCTSKREVCNVTSLLFIYCTNGF